ncbi:Uncharacterised protein [Mycobacteroides abscessus subsp. abscessus]|nr:Uncharacterised protein [Mycobacteroides abscessus subsp. abscessus]
MRIAETSASVNAISSSLSAAAKPSATHSVRA